ncbi:MAG TPA: hypothetical protein VIG44_01275, partial [Thermomicrobiales bacterium]
MRESVVAGFPTASRREGQAGKPATTEKALEAQPPPPIAHCSLHDLPQPWFRHATELTCHPCILPVVVRR